jgi:hypothetical protein
MLWTKIILKKFLFESCVNDFIISHSFSSEKLREIRSKQDAQHTYGVTLRRVRLLLPWKNKHCFCLALALKIAVKTHYLDFISKQHKKRKTTSSFKQNDKKFLSDFSQICISRPIFLQVTSSTLHENPSLGGGTDT